jgi:hypothetical protein
MVVGIDLAVHSSSIPEGTKKIKFRSVAYFSSRANSVFIHHIHHAIHHVLTTKKPHLHPTFFETPSKIAAKSPKST